MEDATASCRSWAGRRRASAIACRVARREAGRARRLQTPCRSRRPGTIAPPASPTLAVEIAHAEAAVEQFEDKAVAQMRQGRVVARPLVAHEGMRAVEFVPGVMAADLFQPLTDQGAAFERDVRVLPAPDHHQL